MVGIVTDGEPFETPASAAGEAYATMPVSRPGLLGTGLLPTLPELTESGPSGWFARQSELATAQEKADPIEALRQGRRLAGIPESEDTPATYAGLKPEGKIDPREAQKRYAPNGEVSFDKPIAPSVAAVMADQAKAKVQRDGVLARWANTTGLVPRITSSLVAGVLDPLNDAALFVPGIGEETFLAGMGRIGLSTAGLPARLAARGLAGAVSADVAMSPLIALQAIQSRSEGDDFTLRDAMYELAFNAALGAIAHAGTGLISRSWRRGVPTELPPDAVPAGAEVREPVPPRMPPSDVVNAGRDVAETPATKTHAAMSAAVAQVIDGREVDVRPVVEAERPPPAPPFQFKPSGNAELDRILGSPELQRAVAAPQDGRIDAADPSKINRANRVPYGAGASNTTDITNVDEHVPPVVVLNGVRFDPAIPVSIHEQVEKHAMEMLMARGMSREDAYTTAHHLFAEPAERQWVEAHGIDWTGYQRWWDTILPRIQHENPENLPPDLYRKPYPHLKPELARREPAGPVPKPTAAERRVAETGAAPAGELSYRRADGEVFKANPGETQRALLDRLIKEGKIVEEEAGVAQPSDFLRTPAAPSGAQPAAPPIDIAAEVARRNVAGGVPEAQAIEIGNLEAEKYRARAEWFEGRRGTAEDLYRAEGAEIVPRRGGDLRDLRERAVAAPEFEQRTEGEPAPTFYSAVARGVDAIPMKKGTAQQWVNALRKQPSVKQEEMDWIGLDDWLKQQKSPVSKEDVADFVRANQIEVKDVVHGGDSARIQELQRQQEEVQRDYFAGNEGAGARLDQINDEIQRASQEAQSVAPKHAGYQLPGGENYRELLLTLPTKRPASEEVTAAERKYNVATQLGKPADEVEALRNAYMDLARRRDANAEDFVGSHWQEPNVVAHVRMNDRTIDGKRTLFVEEVQSDWHQQGREKGYQGETPELTADMPLTAHRRHTETGDYWEIHRADTDRFVTNVTDPDLGAAEAITEARNRIRGQVSISIARDDRVPDAPFKTTWPELAMKRMIRYAADHGYDQIAWTPGVEQVKRYETAMRQQVQSIAWKGGGDTPAHRIVEIEPRSGGTYEVHLNDRGVVTDTGSELREARGKPIEDLVGKEIARRILDENGGKVEGEGLTIGGKGMTDFYDRHLVDVANKLGKKFGAKVGEVGIRMGDTAGYDISNFDGQGWRLLDRYGHRIEGSPTFRSGSDAEAWLRENGPSLAVHSLPIPEAMADAAKAGQPLFQAQKGKITLGEGDKPSVIKYNARADITTFLHEPAHDFLAQLLRDAQHPLAPDQLKADALAAAKYGGLDKVEDFWETTPGGRPTARSTRAHERFANGWLQYIYEGVAPSPQLVSVFQKFTQWMLDIYKTLKDLSERAGGKPDEWVPLSDEIRGVFDRLLAKEPQPQRQPLPTLPELAGQQAGMYARGFAPGIPQADFDAMSEAVYGKSAEETAAEPVKPKAAVGAGTEAHPLDAEIANLEQALAGKPMAADDLAALEQTRTAVAAADLAASGYEQAAQCLVDAGV